MITILLIFNLLLNGIQTAFAIGNNSKFMTTSVRVIMMIIISWSLYLLMLPVGIKGQIVYLMTHVGLYAGALTIAAKEEQSLFVVLFYFMCTIAHIVTIVII